MSRSLNSGYAVLPASTLVDERDKLSRPTLNFPAAFLRSANMFMHAGATVNGEKSIVWPLLGKKDDLSN